MLGRTVPAHCDGHHSMASLGSYETGVVSPIRRSERKACVYFFFPILRETSSKIFGRRSARTLSTMLAIAAGSDCDSEDAASGVFSAPAATAIAASSWGADAPASASFASLGSPDSRMRRQLAHAAAVV